MEPEQKLIKERISKLNQLKELGINPYAYKFEKKNYIKDIIKEFSKIKILA